MPTEASHKLHLASPTTSCSTGCVVGSHAHDHADHLDSEAASREHLVPAPPGVVRSSTSPTSVPYNTYGKDVSLVDLIARYGNSSSTAWLDSERYKIWRPAQPIPESEFTPVQGYIQKDPFIFAWGNPLVSSRAALEKTARAFIAFAEASHLRPVWSCVDHDLETVLAGEALGWVTVSCIFEDVIDPAHVVELVSPGEHGERDVALDHAPGNLTQNLKRAEVEQVEVHEAKHGEWDHRDRQAVEMGIREWKAHKNVMDLETMTVDPWTDELHRRYWIAKRHNRVVGVAILSQTSPTAWQIVKCLTFRHASHGTSETLVYTALKDLYTEQEKLSKATASTPVSSTMAEAAFVSGGAASQDQPERAKNRVSVSFGIAASDHLEPGHNVSGWQVNVLSKTYHAVSGITHLMQTAPYRKEFETRHEPMYVCYPANGFGFIAIGALILALRK